MRLGNDRRVHIILTTVLFSVCAGTRSVMEIVAGPFPIGWDTVAGYSVWLRAHDPIFLQNGPIFQMFLYGIEGLTAQPSLSVKISMVIMCGLLPVSIYAWINSLTKVRQVAFISSLLTCFYFPILRLSWDLGRNMLSLSLGLFALVLLNAHQERLKLLLGVFLLALSALADPITLPIIFFVLIAKKNFPVRVKILTLSLIAMIFLGTVPYFETDLISLVLQGMYGVNSIYFIAYLALPILPFLVLSIKSNAPRNPELVVWTIVCLVISLFLISGYGYRFDLLAFVALVPFITIRLYFSRRRYIMYFFSALVLFLGVSYIAFPVTSPFPYYVTNQVNSPIPPSMITNTMTIPQSYDTIRLLSQNHAVKSCVSSVIATDQFYDYILQSGIPSCAIAYVGQNYTSIPEVAANISSQGKEVFIVWFDASPGQFSFMTDFKPVESINTIVLYTYTSSVNSQ